MTIYASASCSGDAVGSGTAEALQGPGIPVTLAEDSNVSLAARAQDAAGNVSACSNAVSYRDPRSLNETDEAGEADWCNLAFPADQTMDPGTSFTVFGRLFEAGVTEASGPSMAVMGEVGLGPSGSDPRTDPAWTWIPMTFIMQSGNDDEYQAQLSAPTTSGSYSYTVRFSLDAGYGWTACDRGGAGSNAGSTFSPTDLGFLTVR